MGASVSDFASATIALDTQNFSVIQFDESINAHLRRNRAKATKAGVLVVTNRPFGMGALLCRKKSLTKKYAFNFQPLFDGIILTGTKSPDHLRENWAAFHARYDQTI